MAVINLNGVQAIKYLQKEGIFPATIVNIKEDSKKEDNGNTKSWTVLTIRTDDGYTANTSFYWTESAMPYVVGDLEHLGYDLSDDKFETNQLLGKRLYISAKFDMVDIKDPFQNTIGQERGRLQVRIDHSMPLETLGQAPAEQVVPNAVPNATMNQPVVNNVANNVVENTPNVGMGQPVNPYATNPVGNPPNNGQTLTPPMGGQPASVVNQPSTTVGNTVPVGNGFANQPVNNGVINPMDQLTNTQPQTIPGLGLDGIPQN